MKSFGTAKLISGEWHITAAPHVMIKLKQVFGRVSKGQYDTITVKDNREICRDIEWFITRYPLDFPGENDFHHMTHASLDYQRTLAQLEKIILPDHMPHVCGLATPLREYQNRLVEVYFKTRCLLNADDIGLGKTAQAIAGMTAEVAMPALVVCYSHLPGQWRDEIKKFLPTAKVHIIEKMLVYELPPADVYVITYHKLAKWAQVLREIVKSFIIDEVQELRHETSQKYLAAQSVRASADWCLGLSATPIHNYGGEIFNIMEIIHPGCLGTRNEFEREWCFSSGKHILLKKPEAFGAWLRENFLMMRRTREDVGRQLPKLQTMVEHVDFHKDVLKEIEDVALELAHRILTGAFAERGAAAREFDIKLRQATGIAKAPFVAAFVKILVDGGRKVVLAGWHREVYDVWAHYFDQDKIRYAFYTGEESGSVKTQNARRMMDGEIDVFIMSLRSGAGLNGLQDVCSTIVHGELVFTKAVHKQITGRLHRDGQDHNVQEFYLVTDGGSDPYLADIIGLKDSQLSGIMEAKATGLEQMDAADLGRVRKMAEQWLKTRRAPAKAAADAADFAA